MGLGVRPPGPARFPAPLRIAPRSSAPADGHREAFESAMGRGEVGGGAGGGRGVCVGRMERDSGNKGISENKRRDETLDEGSGGALGGFAPSRFPSNYFCEANSRQATLQS